MIEFSYSTPSTLEIKNSDKKSVYFDFHQNTVLLEDFNVSYPGEYEKSGNLVEVKEYTDILFYKMLIDGKHICIVTSDSFELKEEILKFFGDVDVLVIVGTKDAVKVFENIEAKVVVPYSDGKDIFLNTLGQHSEEVKSYKVGNGELDGDRTEYVNLGV